MGRLSFNISEQGNLKKYIQFLSEIDDYDNKGNLKGTKDSYVVGIIDRLNQPELMLTWKR